MLIAVILLSAYLFIIFVLPFLFKAVRFLFWLCYDLFYAIKSGEKKFNEYGVTLYCGKQGSGKTTAMVEYLERMRKKYPDCLIYTNFDYANQDGAFTDWEQLLTIRNGEKGVIFAIDEIHSEFSNNDWSTFPSNLLREITQQRKQRIKIIGSSQRFNRVVVQLREQTFEVIECNTLFGRWTFTKAFDADDYNAVIDDPEKKLKLRRLWRRSFIQTNKLRSLFDTYAKIEAMRKNYKEGKYKREVI